MSYTTTATSERNIRSKQDHEGFVEFARLEDLRIRTDEITQASEKIALPMENPFEYERGPDGELWFQGERLLDIFDRGIDTARQVAMMYPQFSVMVTRSLIERQEYDDQRTLAHGGEDDPDILVVASKIADAALAGQDFGESFDTVRKKTLIRIHERTEGGVRTTSLSLDRSDHRGIQMIGALFGVTIADDEGSEGILAKRMWGYRDELAKEPAVLIREIYDNELKRQYGGEWYAGRRDSPVLNAKIFVEQQADLLDEHLNLLKAIRKFHSGEELGIRLKKARYDFAASVDLRAKGRTDIKSVGGGGDVARGMGLEYKDDCPDGSGMKSRQSISASESMRRSGYSTMDKISVSKECPLCGDEDVLTVKKGEMILGSCGCAKNICTGEIISLNSNKDKPNQSVLPMLTFETNQPGKKNDDALIKKIYGQFAVRKTVTGIGTAKTAIVNRFTNAELN